MKMDRNLPENDGTGKYLVINLRRLNDVSGNPSTFERWMPAVQQALDLLDGLGVLEWGTPGAEDEFFLIKLKDRHAQAALDAYADSVRHHDTEFADEVLDLAARAGSCSPFCKQPD